MLQVRACWYTVEIGASETGLTATHLGTATGRSWGDCSTTEVKPGWTCPNLIRFNSPGDKTAGM